MMNFLRFFNWKALQVKLWVKWYAVFNKYSEVLLKKMNNPLRSLSPGVTIYNSEVDTARMSPGCRAGLS